jgi:hypothetical protein
MRADEPLGASSRALRAGRLEVSLLSRGDRVRARVARAASARAPVILIGAPDGSAAAPFSDAALGAWSSFATVAALDLPLCGARKSDKLSADAFRPGAALAERLRPELELQLGSDLARLLDWLTSDAGGETAAAWLALGLAARLEPRPADPRLRAWLRAAEPGRALAIERSAAAGVAPGPVLADFEPSPRNLDALAEILKRVL